MNEKKKIKIEEKPRKDGECMTKRTFKCTFSNLCIGNKFAPLAP